ncbi:hypothetical protein HBE96_23110 [Clostridium sp. P21]|uniref:Uncharacterized protein n=1 Tax=Clostridium muellerianum TaxID=2716538 RepID=A0A7Y0EL62_9CLOT|nr:hypothetical protein [Clostridium muellerianum]NMM65471.1 hypothetical protein [Clostridium muellerianum]
MENKNVKEMEAKLEELRVELKSIKEEIGQGKTNELVDKCIAKSKEFRDICISIQIGKGELGKDEIPL